MQQLGYKVKRVIFISLFILSFPLSGMSNYMNFLPMEDSMSTVRNTPGQTGYGIKPYRESFSLGTQQSTNSNYIYFTTSDICAFILLAGIYVMLVKRSSKSRSASF